MKALTFRGVEDIRLSEVDDPQLTSSGNVIVEVEVAGLCGSDLHPYFGREEGLAVGTVMGHEFVGRIVAAGDAVQLFQAGDRVVAPFSTSCGECFYCRSRLTARCERGELFGWVEGAEGLHGAQAERVRVPFADSTLVPVPEEVSSDVALLCGDVLPTGLFTADLGRVDDGKVVAVLGCGPVGLMCILAARTRGAEQVFAFDTVSERLELAEGLGATAVDLSEEPPAMQVLAATGGRGADSVLEAAGSAEATRLAVDLVRPGGVIAVPGVHTEAQFAFSPAEAYDKNLTYRTGRCPARTYIPEALELAESLGEELGSIITHRLPLEKGPGAYQMFGERQDGCVKVLLYP